MLETGPLNVPLLLLVNKGYRQVPDELTQLPAGALIATSGPRSE